MAALLEESGKQGICFYYPIGRGASDNLRSIPISTYRKFGMYFATTSVALFAFSIFLFAIFPQSENGFGLFAGALLGYILIRLIVLFPKMNISARKINKASPGPLYAIVDQSCFCLAVAMMEWLLIRQLPQGQGDWFGLFILMMVVWAILPLINLAILLIRQRAEAIQ